MVFYNGTIGFKWMANRTFVFILTWYVKFETPTVAFTERIGVSYFGNIHYGSTKSVGLVFYSSIGDIRRTKTARFLLLHAVKEI